LIFTYNQWCSLDDLEQSKTFSNILELLTLSLVAAYLLHLKFGLGNLRHCVWAVENLRNLLETVAACFRKEEVRDSEEYDKKAAEDNVVPPRDVLEADWVDEGGDDEGSINGEEFACQTFGSDAVRKDFGAVSHKEGCVGDIVMEEEGEEAHNDDNAGGLGACLSIDSGARGPNDVGDQHSNA
jgi:hypothetical protein